MTEKFITKMLSDKQTKQVKNYLFAKNVETVIPLCSLYSQVRDLVPESQAYMDLLAFERKLDATITRKRLDIQEALKRPMKVCNILAAI